MTPKEYQSRLWQEIEGLGERCSRGVDAPMELCGICEPCQSDLGAARRALFQVIHLHRPHEGMPEYCSSCERYSQLASYPCETLRAVAGHLGVEDWVADEVEILAADLRIETFSDSLSYVGSMRIVHLPTGLAVERHGVIPGESALSVKGELIEELKVLVREAR